MTMYRVGLGSPKEKADVLVVPLWEGKVFEKTAKEIDKEYAGLMQSTVDTKDFEGNLKQMLLLVTRHTHVPQVLLVGLGKQDDFNIRIWKQVIGMAVIAAQKKKKKNIRILVPQQGIAKLGARRIGQELVIAVETAQYAFDEHKQKDARVFPLSAVTFIGEFGAADARRMEQGIVEGKIIAEAVNFTRYLGDIPPSIMTPTLLASEATKLCQGNSKLKARILSRPEMKKLGMGCLLGVSSGSVEEPKFIIVEYHGGSKEQKPTVLVGKGITFDSGGLSLKPGDYLSDMKFDMLGAATVLGTIRAAAGLGLKKNLVGLISSCENMPSGASFRPDDILTAMNGRSVEIINTDAEGRLILADALSYAAMKYTPKEVIDFATLTGACCVALGNERSGLFSDQEHIVQKLLHSAQAIGENFWRLPLGEEYTEANKSEVADIKNLSGVGNPRYAGASTAAAFLQYFTLDMKTGKPAYPWAHIDLSSSYYDKGGRPWIRGGANGFGVQTMVEYLR